MTLRVTFNSNNPRLGETGKWHVLSFRSSIMGVDESLSTHNSKQAAINAARRKARQGERIEVRNKSDGTVKAIREGS